QSREGAPDGGHTPRLRWWPTAWPPCGRPAASREFGAERYDPMEFPHADGVKPAYSAIELGRGADGIVIEVLDHAELVIKDMNHPFKLGRNRVALERRVLRAVVEATQGLGATGVFNHGTDSQECSWLVRERVFDVKPRGSQQTRTALIDVILSIH